MTACLSLLSFHLPTHTLHALHAVYVICVGRWKDNRLTFQVSTSKVLIRFNLNQPAFMIGLLVLPHSNADTERIFSQINLIKSKTWNKLHTQTVSSLLTTKDGIPDCRQFNPDNQMIKSIHLFRGTVMLYTNIIIINYYTTL